MGYAKYWEDNSDYYFDNEFLRKGAVTVDFPNKIKCPYCNDLFQNSNDVWNHIKLNHSRKPLCVYVDKNFSPKIVAYAIDSVCNKQIDEIIKMWNTQLEKGSKIGLKLHNPLLDDVANRYLDGIYNYFAACESKGKYKKNLFGEAIGILKSYNTIDRRGAFILQIIYYQFNWLDNLNKFCSAYQNDIFSQLLKFYNGIWDIDCYVDRYTDRKDISKVIYIDDDESEYIDAVLQFLNNDIESVQDYLDKVYMKNMGDQNLSDRIIFLAACVAKKDGNITKANEFRGQILSKELRKKLGRIVNGK